MANSILSFRQLGFRPGNSTPVALLTTTHDWQRCLDLGLSSVALFLDMSKALDEVPHSRLLHSLQAVGVTGPLLAWFESYLSNRSQESCLVVILFTSPCPIRRVPQGSILGQLLFIIYINSLANLHSSPGTSLILYADDILLYRPLCPSSHTSVFQKDVDLIFSWLALSSRLINPSKSSLLVISRCRTEPCVSITINSSTVT